MPPLRTLVLLAGLAACGRHHSSQPEAPDPQWVGCYSLAIASWQGDRDSTLFPLQETQLELTTAEPVTQVYDNGPGPHDTRPLRARLADEDAEWWVDRPSIIMVNTAGLTGTALYLVPLNDTLLSGLAVAFSDRLRLRPNRPPLLRLARAFVDARRIRC